jgi:hypothetical protein
MDALDLFQGIAGGGLFGGDAKENGAEVAPVTKSHGLDEVTHAPNRASGAAKPPDTTPERSDDSRELWHHYAD